MNHIIFNRHWLFSLIGDFICYYIGINLFIEPEGNDIGFGVFFIILGIVLTLCALFVFPIFAIVGRRGISFYYLIFMRDKYLWENVYALTVEYTSRKGIPILMDSFKIHGTSENKHRFFMTGQIARSWRARKLLEHYSKDKIESFFFDDIKNSIKERKEKKLRKEQKNLERKRRKRRRK